MKHRQLNGQSKKNPFRTFYVKTRKPVKKDSWYEKKENDKRA